VGSTALINTHEYASSIDETISPTFDLVIVEKSTGWSREIYGDHSDATSTTIKNDDLSMLIKVHNTDGNVILEMDDDNAFEGETVSTSPPVTYNGKYPKDYLYMKNVNDVNYYHSAILGPGFSIGISPTHPDGFSTMRRKGIFTNGNIKAGGNDKTLIMDRDGFEVNSGKRTVYGQFDMPIAGTNQFIQRTTIENGLILETAVLSVVNLPAAKPVTKDDPTALQTNTPSEPD
jgi:hypothetical protein